MKMNFKVKNYSLTLKFDNFSKTLLVIASFPPLSVIMTLCVQKSICNSSLRTLGKKLFKITVTRNLHYFTPVKGNK